MSKSLAVYKIVSTGYIVNFGENDIKVNEAEFNKYKDKYTFIFVNTKRDPITETDKNGNKKTLTSMKDILSFYNECQKELFKASNGFINFHTAPSFTKLAMYVWNVMKKKSVFKESEPLSEIEINFLRNTKGALSFGSSYEGKGHLYDFVSFYPSILFDINFFVPIKPPIEKTITKWSQALRYEKYEYGYYRCKIEKSGVETIDRLFKFHEKDIYTHIDIKSATKLKLKCKLVNDGKPNMWYYPPSHLEKSHKMFKNFVGYMFRLKEKKVKGAKNIINALWGAFSQRNRDIIPIRDSTKETKILKIDIGESGNMELTIEKEKTFKYSYARIKPFLLAQGRYNLLTTIYPFGDTIVRANTDGFISKEQLDIPTGEHLGGLNYEGYSNNIKVQSTNNVSGNKKKDIIKPEKIETEDEELKRLNDEFEKLLQEDAKKLYKNKKQ